MLYTKLHEHNIQNITQTITTHITQKTEQIEMKNKRTK